MAHATITKPDGTIVVLKGTPSEIAEVLARVEKSGRERNAASKSARSTQKAPSSLSDLLMSLHDGGFFKQPRGLSDVKAGLAELGHVFPITTLSPAMLRLVRRRMLRRVKQKNQWFYTGVA